MTLIELLVALAIMAVLALMSWRTLDTLTTTEAVVTEHTTRWSEWQTSLAQWSTDLDHLQDTQVVPALLFDGQVLRLVRQTGGLADPEPPQLMVVAWALLPDPTAAPNALRWYRWSSPPLWRRTDLEQAWQAADQWGHRPTPELQQRATALPLADGWQLYFHRDGTWTNPLSDTGTAGAEDKVPDGIRLHLTLPAQGVDGGGGLTKDWAHPTLAGGKAA